MIELFHGDCLELIKQIPDGSVDLILQDPPYNKTACHWEWDIMTKIDEFWAEWKRIIKPNGAIVMTASQPFTTKIIASNYKDFKYCWVWEKSKAIGFFNAKNRPMHKHEDIVIFSLGDCANRCKNKMKYNPQNLVEINKFVNGIKSCKADKRGHNFSRPSNKEKHYQQYTNYPSSVLKFPSEGKTSHPTQKPVALMEYLIKTYTNEGGTVFDGFMGSGTTGVACKNTGRKFIGIELDHDYFDIADRRINGA